MIKFSDCKKFNKKEGPSEDASINLEGETKRSEDGTDLAGRSEGEWKGGHGQVWEDTGKKPRGPGE